MALIQDAMSASMPGTAKQFLGSVQPKPMGQMIMYVGILALLPLVGYILGGLIGWGGMTWGIVMGIIMYIGLIASVIGAGMAVAMLSQSIIGRQISQSEGVTVVGYAATPVMLIGFIAGIMSGNWGLSMIGMILSFLAWIYMAYLLFVGGGVRYGPDKALGFVAVAVIAGIVISFIFSAIAGAMVMGMLWQGVGPYGDYGRAMDLARAYAYY
jgi:hypothetical protein